MSAELGLRLEGLALQINELHEQLLGLGQSSLQRAAHIGDLLTQARNELKLAHGQWLPWLKVNIRFSQPTVWRYMRLFKLSLEGKLFNLNNLTDAYCLRLERELRREEKQTRHENFKAQLSLAGLVSRKPEEPTGPFDIVLADPPWRYSSNTTTPDRSVENHYPTAFVEEIISHQPDVAKDAVLFLWATAPLLPEALCVMRGWGFAYKTNAVWDKGKIGLGYWFRVQHELLLVGTKGEVSPPVEAARISSVFREERGAHSTKPEAVYEWIELAFPGRAKLEMYARRRRFGWASWGNEL